MWHREYQANVFQGLKEKNGELPPPLPETPPEACAKRHPIKIQILPDSEVSKVYSTPLTTAAITEAQAKAKYHGVMLDKTARHHHIETMMLPQMLLER